MASFSQGFLSNLGRPAMTQSMFDLGSTLGKMPQQRRDKQKREQDSTALAGVTDPAGKLRLMAQQSIRDGDKQGAALYMQRAEEVDARSAQANAAAVQSMQAGWRFNQEVQSAGQEAAEKKLVAESVTVDIAALVRDKTVPEGVRRQAAALLPLISKDPTAADSLRGRVDAIMKEAGKDPTTISVLNFVDPQDPSNMQSVRSDDDAGIDRLISAGWVKAGALSQGGDEWEMTLNADGSTTMRRGPASGGTGVGAENRNQALTQQRDNMSANVDAVVSQINSLKNPERAFGVQGAAQDPDTPLGAAVNVMMQFDAGEMTVEAISGMIGKQITKEELAEVKKVRSSLANTIANARDLTRGIQNDRQASPSELALAAKVVRGLDASDTLDDTLASLENYKELIRLQAERIGGAPEVIEVDW